MSFIRNRKCFVAVAVVASLAAVGCSKDKQEGETAASGASKSATAGDKKAAGAKGNYAYLPTDTNFVIGVNLAQIRASKLFKDMAEPAIVRMAGADYEKVKAACGFDPLEQVQTVIVGGVAGKDDRVSAAVHGMNAGQMEKCGKAMAEMQGETLEIAQEGKLTKIVNDGGDPVWAAWTDDSTMVVTGPNKALAESVLGGKEGLSGNKDMLDLIGKVDTGAALWLTFREQDDAPAALAAPVPVKAAHVSLSLANGLHLDATVRQGGPDEAQNTVAEITSNLEQLKASPYGKYISKLELKASESDVVAKLSLNEAELQELLNDPSVKMLGSMIGL